MDIFNLDGIFCVDWIVNDCNSCYEKDVIKNEV